jgi:uracil-DNA glycosylase
MEQTEALSELRVKADRCRRCPAGYSREHVVIYRGMLEPQLVFIGQSPGREEDRLGIPFVGPSGTMLENELITRHLLPSWGIINIINCRPPGDEYRLTYAEACAPFLREKLKILHPKWVCCIGNDAYAAVAAVHQSNHGLVPWPVFRLIHPSAVLRHPSWRERWDAGWQTLMEQVNTRQ